MNIDSKNKSVLPVILLFGPTAVGKSRIIFNLFHSGFEVINADSQQVYKYMDIGTAKPDKSELQQVPHHLVSIIDPKEQFNAGVFVEKANKLVLSIWKKRKIPVIAGGTGFYFKNFIFGLPEAPPSDQLMREKLKAVAQEKGINYLYDKLKQVDPDYACQIKKNDTLRILRALEVFEMTGNPLSHYKVPSEERTDIIMYRIGLILPRSELNDLIENRVEKMFYNGLVDEVKSLIRMGYTRYDPGMKSIGYREFFQMQVGCFLFKDIKELIKKNSRHYAKRQITFFKSFCHVSWFHPEDIHGIQTGIRQFLASLANCI